MFYIAVSVCFAVCVFGAPAPSDVLLEKQQPTVIPIVSQSDELEPNGTYHFSYETGNGIKREEISYDKVVPKAKSRSADSSNEGGEDSNGDSDEIHVQMGSYSYTAPDGTLISVRYIADENGFQPIGDHIPRIPSATGGSSSGEKSGRALNVADNAGSPSAPATATKPAAAPEFNSAETSEGASIPASAEAESSNKKGTESSTTESSNAPESAPSTKSSSEDVSTTEAAKSSETSEPSSEASTNASTPAPDISTPAGDASTAAADASTPAAEQATQNPEVSTTEVASTTKAVV